MSFEKPKKYVFHLTQENARYFATLEQSARHDLINKMVESYYKKKNTIVDSDFIKKQLKYIIIGCVAIVLTAVIVAGLVNFIFASSKTNDYFTQGFLKYDQSQKNRR